MFSRDDDDDCRRRRRLLLSHPISTVPDTRRRLITHEPVLPSSRHLLDEASTPCCVAYELCLNNNSIDVSDLVENEPKARAANVQMLIISGSLLLALVICCFVALLATRRRRRRRLLKEKERDIHIAMDIDSNPGVSDERNLLYRSDVTIGEHYQSDYAARKKNNDPETDNPLFDSSRRTSSEQGGYTGSNSTVFDRMSRDGNLLQQWSSRSKRESVHNPLIHYMDENDMETARVDALEGGGGIMYANAVLGGVDATAEGADRRNDSGAGATADLGADASVTADAELMLMFDTLQSTEDIFLAVQEGAEELAAIESIFLDLDRTEDDAHIRAELAEAKAAFETVVTATDAEGVTQFSAMAEAEKMNFAKKLLRAKRRLQRVEQQATASAVDMKFSQRERLLAEINRARSNLKPVKSKWSAAKEMVRSDGGGDASAAPSSSEGGGGDDAPPGRMPKPNKKAAKRTSTAFVVSNPLATHGGDGL